MVLVGFGIFAGASVQAQAQTPEQNQSSGIQVATSYHSDVSLPLRDIGAGLASCKEKARARDRLGSESP